jgi:hypothetical protein
MTKVMQTRTMPVTTFRATKPNPTRYPDKDVFCSVLHQPGTCLADEKAGRSWSGMNTISEACVPAQCQRCRSMYGHQSGLSELGPADRQIPSIEIDILAVEGDRLADPKACHGEQAKQSDVGLSTKARR